MKRFVLVCDHATNFVPEELAGLGLPSSEVERHIGWDIGAAGVTRVLADLLGAPAVYSEVSRLVVDCNRQLDSTGLIPEISDGVVVPGNLGLLPEQRMARIDRWFQPYHDAVEAILRDEDDIFLSIHSMTPVMAGVARPWQIALSSHLDRRLTDPVLAALRAAGDITVGDNEPYDLDPSVDYSTPVHALSRGLLHLQVEFRQDEVVTPAQQHWWAERFAESLLTGVDSIDPCWKPKT